MREEREREVEREKGRKTVKEDRKVCVIGRKEEEKNGRQEKTVIKGKVRNERKVGKDWLVKRR